MGINLVPGQHDGEGVQLNYDLRQGEAGLRYVPCSGKASQEFCYAMQIFCVCRP